MEHPLLKRKGITLYRAAEDELPAVAEFVVKENYSHHSHNQEFNLKNEVEYVLDEERRIYNLSRIIVAKDANGRIIGSIRVARWDKKATLPLESLFGISPLDIPIRGEIKTFWHVGRFSISRMPDVSNNLLMRTLMIYAVYPIVHSPQSCLLAEVDRRLFGILGRIGIDAYQIAPSIHHLASETIPIYSVSSSMMKFYKRNKFLHRPNILTISN